MTWLFDPGLQPERTELARRRTCLSLGVGSVVAMRILPEVFEEPLWVLGGVFGIVLSGVLWFAARRRYQRTIVSLERDGERAHLPDGRDGAVLTAFVTAIGLVSLMLILFAR